jgi:hypothetical protein
MDDQSRHDDAYIRHLSKITGVKLDEPPKPVIGRKSPQNVPAKKKRSKVLIVCGVVLAILVLLIARAIFITGMRSFAFPGVEVQQEANAWALSGSKSFVLKRLNKADGVEFPTDSIDSSFLGDDRWRVWGMAHVLDGDQLAEQRKWTAEIKYFKDTKTGEMSKVFLDDSLIYSR